MTFDASVPVLATETRAWSGASAGISSVCKNGSSGKGTAHGDRVGWIAMAFIFSGREHRVGEGQSAANGVCGSGWGAGRLT
eukprot:15129289-Alexandrium_andersonii.AAC.1